MSTLLNFIKKLQSGTPDADKLNVDTHKDKYRLIKNAEFEVQWMFNNAAVINNTPILKTLNTGIPEFGRNINDNALINDGNFYVFSIDLDNLTSGESFNIGKAYSDSNNPGINAIVLGNAMVTPQEYVLKMTFRDTMNSSIDNFITQWMYYNASPKGFIPETIKNDPSKVGSFEQRLTASLYVRLIRFFDAPNCSGSNTSRYKQIFRTYVFEDIFPTNIDNPNFTNEENNFVTRDINFSFSRFKLVNNSYTEVAESETVLD